MSGADLRRKMGTRFTEAAMARNYQFRPPYPPEVFETLIELIRDAPRKVLDAGCGPGKIARAIADQVERIDAVDPSAEMISAGRALPGGQNNKIRWLKGKIEEVELGGPYALIVAGASFHWMNPEMALRRFSEVISPGGSVAVLDGDAAIDPPWSAEEQRIMIDLVTKIDGSRPKWWARASDLMRQPIVNHPQFVREGSRVTAPFQFSQPIADYVRCLHSRATFSEAYLGEELCREFDLAITELLVHYAIDGIVTFSVQTRIEWGRPLAGS